jgi:uncharacterized protein (DUF305 family)
VTPDAAADPEGPDGDERVWFAGTEGWSTAKVAGLVLAVALVAVMMTAVVVDRRSGQAADSVDVGFLQDMVHHHEQAIQLGLIGADTTTDHTVRHFAIETLVSQQWELGYMTALLEEWGHGTGDLDRDAMAWMGMPTELDRMPGMIPEERMRAFRDLTGPAADREFLRLMTEHHEGGLHMAADAAERASDPRVRDLAARMADKQRKEIVEYTGRARQLGFDL